MPFLLRHCLVLALAAAALVALAAGAHALGHAGPGWWDRPQAPPYLWAWAVLAGLLCGLRLALAAADGLLRGYLDRF